MRSFDLVHPRTEPGARWVRPASYLPVPALLLLNAWWFPPVVGSGYFEWYLEQGVLLGLTGSFVAMIVEELEAETGLISANPAEYFGTCMQLTGAVFLALSSVASPRTDADREGRRPGAALRLLWDLVMTLALVLVIAILTLAWMTVVAPLNYLATLVAGAPARLSLRGSRREVFARVVGSQVGVTEVRDPEPSASPPAGVRLSLTARPLAVTQAIVALLLALAALLS